ncbi:Vomp family autotransporter [Bartonella pachyuromydis]
MMKKLYTTQTACDLNFSRSHERTSFFKVVSLGTAVVLFLSNVSPVSSAKLDLTKVSLESVKNSAVVYPQTILSPYIDDNSGMDGDKSVINILTVDGSSIRGDAQNIFTAGIVVVSNSKKDKKTKNAVVLNPKTYTTKKKSAATGSMARALGLSSSAIDSDYNNQDDTGEYTFVNDDSPRARAEGNADIAIETEPETRAYSNVILGDGSATETPAGVYGYSSLRKGPANSDNLVWKSTAPAATVGDSDRGITRQIQGVAAGTKFSDAANVGQLKALEIYVDQGWKLSIGGENATTVGIKNVVDLSTGSNNLEITKGKDNNNVKFDLAENLELISVTTGQSSMSDDGFIIEHGPMMTTDGIDADNKKIRGVAAGEEDTDAVNFKQLTEVKGLISKAGGWKLSVEDGDATDIQAGGTVNFAAAGEDGSKNIKIVRDDNNEVRFDLAEKITIKSVTAGNTLISDTGFAFVDGNGPQITVDGIDAGNKKITAVAEGTDDTDAVNFAQLQETKDQIVKNSLVKQDEGKAGWITIGKETGGSVINITNKSGDARTISGVKAAENDDEAVNKKQLDGEIADITYSIKVIKEANSFAVLYDKNGDGTVNYNSVTLGGDKTTAPVALHNVQAGTIAEGSHDAINGSQIEKISRDVANIFGGNAEFSEGILFGPLYHLSQISEDGVVSKDHNNVGSALTGLDENINYVNSRIKYVDNKFDKFSQDALLWDNGKGAFSARHGAGDQKTNSKITSLLKGDVTKDSTDAINGSQLYTMGDKIADYFGGVAHYENGKWVKGPEFKVTERGENGDLVEGTYFNVTDAFKGVDNSITDIYNQINNVTENSLVKQEGENGLISVGKETGGTKISIANKNNQERTILGVKAAELSSTSTEAVNGSQLFATDERIANVTGDLSKVAQNTSKYFGGNTDVLNGVEPAFLIDGKPYHNVTEAFTGVDVSIHRIDNKISNLEKNNLVQQEGDVSGIITIGKDTVGTEINIAGYAGAGRTISGVRAAEKGDEAVNKDQLDKSIEKISKDIETASIAAVLYDKNEDGTVNYKSVTLGGSDNQAPVALHNVQAGIIAEESHDAINGSQINKISGDIANFFGGGTEFNNGVFSGPQYNLSKVSADGNVEQKAFDNVGSALTGLDANVKNVNSRLTHVTNEFNQKFDDFSKDALLWSEEEQAFSARHEKDGRKTDSKITSLLNGDVTKDSTDAVNGSQLYTMGDKIANYFGGGARYENGEWGEPTFKISQRNEDGTIVEKKHHNVADAFEGVDNSITDIYNQINNVTENSFVKQEGEDDPITVGKETGGTKISIANKDGQERTISGVKEATLSITSTESVNGSQLFNIAQNTSAYFGGSTDVIEGIKPTFVIDGETYRNVTEAFTGVNVSIHNINDKIIEMKENSLVKWDEGQRLITIGKDKSGTEINIAGYASVARKISGVQAAEKGDEAVNKDQLDKSIEKISKDIEAASVAAVLYDKDEDGIVNYGSVTLGGDTNKTPVALLNVKDGKIAENSHDAINGSQINEISKDIANYFGGDAKFVDGAFKGPKYTLSVITEDGQVAKANYHDVGSALTGLDANVKSVNNRITNVANNFNQKIEGISKDALLWDDEEQAFVARHEKDGKKTNSKLKYLVDGDISADSTDAINGSQLYSISNQLAAYFGGGAKYENGQWTSPQFKIVQVNADGTTVENTHNNVADAFGDVNKNMSNINNRIDDVINKVDSDALKWNKEKGAYDATHDGTPSKIINVADGKIEKGSKDAVNGGQLWQTNERVAKVENRVTDVENHVEIIDKRVDNISNTIGDIGDTIANINVKVDKIDDKVNNISEDAVRYDRDENGKKTNKITLKGSDPSEPVMIDNVADGRIEKGSKEAVNGGQLHDYTKEQMKIVLDESKRYTDQRVNNIVIDAMDDAVDKSKQYTDMKFNALNYSIEGVRKEARQAAAIGLAVSNLRYFDDPGSLSVSFGSGTWRGQSAFALGAGYTSENGKIRSNLSATSAGGHWGVGGAITLKIK